MTMDHWQWCRQQEIRGKKWGSEGHRWQAGSKTGGRGGRGGGREDSGVSGHQMLLLY